MKLWSKVLILVLLNVACFYSLKWYNDTRQTRLISALLPSVVKVSPIGHIWVEQLILTSEGFDIKRVYKGFGIIGHGSGVIVNTNGTIVTCAHVVHNTMLAEVSVKTTSIIDRIFGKTEKTVKAYVLGRDEKHDVAILRLISPEYGLRPVKTGKRTLRGLPVLTIGFPGPFVRYVTMGVISGYMDDSTLSDLVIAPGNSGGGVFTINGALIGLARAVTGPYPIPTYQGFSILVSIEHINEMVRKYNGF
jgi:S1-C subfamily serine protease